MRGILWQSCDCVWTTKWLGCDDTVTLREFMWVSINELDMGTFVLLLRSMCNGCWVIFIRQ